MNRYDNGETYLEEINHVSVLESIDEVFDSATSLMTQNSVMYGSTVTALIAGLPICADLDIAVSKQEYTKLCRNFSSSVKWLQVNGKRVPERKLEDPHNHNFSLETVSAPYDGKNPYQEAKHLPISKMVAFEAVNQSRVQIVESKAMTGDKLEDSLEVVRRVDFTFCGMAIDRYGRMLEVIPHAYDDCKQRIIRIQNYQPAMNADRMKERLYKYIKRGWGMSMSIDQAVANLNRAKAEHAKRLGKKSKKKAPRPMALFKIKRSPKMGFILETKLEVRRLIGATSPIRDAVNHCAVKHFGIKMDSTINSNSHLIFWASKNVMSGTTAKQLIDITSEFITKKYKLDPKRLRQEEKMSKMTKMDKMYTSPKKFAAKQGGYNYGGYNYGGSASSTTSSTGLYKSD